MLSLDQLALDLKELFASDNPDRTSLQGLRQRDSEHDGSDVTLIEQNPEKSSKLAQRAASGANIAWVFDDDGYYGNKPGVDFSALELDDDYQNYRTWSWEDGELVPGEWKEVPDGS